MSTVTTDAYACISEVKDVAARRASPVSKIVVVEQLVIQAFGLDVPTLISDRRGRAPVALARQVAIYLLHVHLGMTLTAAAWHFRRDRTTAGHACRRVEDRREDGNVDRMIEEMEMALDRWRGRTSGTGVPR